MSKNPELAKDTKYANKIITECQEEDIFQETFEKLPRPEKVDLKQQVLTPLSLPIENFGEHCAIDLAGALGVFLNTVDPNNEIGKKAKRDKEAEDRRRGVRQRMLVCFCGEAKDRCKCK